MNDTTSPQDAVRINSDLVRLLYRQTPTVLATIFVVGAITAWGLWGWVDADALLFWYAVVFVYTALRGLVLRVLWRRAGGRDEALLRFARLYAVASTLSGLMWGWLAWLFVPSGTAEAILLISLVLAGMIGGARASLAPYPPAQWGYTLGAFLPLIASYAVRGEHIYVAMAAMCTVYVVAMLGLSRITHSLLRESIALRLRNLALIDQLTEEKEKAEEANRAKSHFLAAASHDLRQPAHALRLFVASLGALAEKGVAVEAGRLGGIVGKMQASLQGLSRLLNGLLDISRLDAGVVKPELRALPLQRVFDAMRANFAELARQKELTLHVRATDLWVSSDRVLLEQIVANLLSNAVRYTTTGEVLLRARRRGAHVALQVWDTGSGIPRDQREAIFREYYQLANPERDLEQGLGIGLSIVRRAAALLGAEVRLRSRVGRGSMFSLRVPAAAPLASTEGGAQTSSGAARSIQVLALDDDRAVLDALEELLGAWGHRLLTATCSADAVALARSQHVQLVIADYRLAEPISGTEALRKILAACAPATVGAIVTGDTSPERIREAAASGYTILHKPIEPAALRKLIDSAVPASPAA